MSRVWAERADRRPNHVPGCGAAPSPRRLRPGVRHHRSPILLPPPAFHSQIPFPTEYPNGFTTFTPSIATTVPTHRRNRPSCLVQAKIARDAHRLLGFAIYVWTIPVEIVQIYIAISVAWGPSGGEVVRELTNWSPRLTPSGRVDAVRGG